MIGLANDNKRRKDQDCNSIVFAVQKFAALVIYTSPGTVPGG